MKVTTDEEGRFAFNRVPPIKLKVFHSPRVSDSSHAGNSEAHWRLFRLKPGETKQLELGGTGRAVIGRFVVHGYDKKIDWRSNVYSIDKVLPDHHFQSRRYALNFKPDGNFRIEDVEGGK